MNQQSKTPLAKLEIDINFPPSKSQKTIFTAKSPNSDRTSEFKLVVAYDDFGNANCARWLFERLVEIFGETLTFIPCFLKFEELSRPHVGERLAKAVAVADMVVIVAYEHADLPNLVEEWVRTWETTSKIEGHRLLALLSVGHQWNDRWTPVQSCLRRVARRTGMRFVLQAAPMSKPECQVAHANP